MGLRTFFIYEAERKQKNMADFKKMYYDLFNSITDAIEILKKAQIKAEEEYINEEEKFNESLKVIKQKEK